MMTEKIQDEFQGHGGMYEVGKDGVRRQVEKPTEDHPDGNAPRDADGKRLDIPADEQQ